VRCPRGTGYQDLHRELSGDHRWDCSNRPARRKPEVPVYREFRYPKMCMPEIIYSRSYGKDGEKPKKDMVLPGLFLLLFFLLALDLGEELVERLFPVCSYLRIDLDELLGDLA
jgi:hypothetical protein